MYRKLGATKGARYVQGITYGGRRDACGVLVGKPEGKKTLGRHRRRWENNIKMDFQKVRCGGMGTCESGDETSGSIKCGEFLD